MSAIDQFVCDVCGKTVDGAAGSKGGVTTKDGVKVTCSIECWMAEVARRDAANELTTLGDLAARKAAN